MIFSLFDIPYRGAMMLRHIMPFVLFIFILAACNAAPEQAATVQSTEVMPENATDVPVNEPTTEPTVAPTIEQASAVPTLEATSVPEGNAYNAPALTSLELINARTGETFTLADFAGKTVFVEPMATWCPNCRAQQGYVSQAMASLSSDDFVFISLCVGENVSNETLANYAQQNSFPQLFAVATSEITNSLVQQFGFSVTSPPSTPHFTISPIGTVSSLRTGYHQASSIIDEVTNAQNS
jgi:thiol-disulfide isomerase/thioredoxin